MKNILLSKRAGEQRGCSLGRIPWCNALYQNGLHGRLMIEVVWRTMT